MLELIMIPALVLAAILLLLSARRLQATERCAAEAEQEAAHTWSTAYQAATTEVNAKRSREAASSYDKGFEQGWNTCVTQFEDRDEPTHARTA